MGEIRAERYGKTIAASAMAAGLLTWMSDRRKIYNSWEQFSDDFSRKCWKTLSPTRFFADSGAKRCSFVSLLVQSDGAKLT